MCSEIFIFGTQEISFPCENTLSLFTKRRKGVKVIIYTKNLTKQLKFDLKKHNSQYEEIIIIKKLTKSHDRFLIIDEKETYHIGASLKCSEIKDFWHVQNL